MAHLWGAQIIAETENWDDAKPNSAAGPMKFLAIAEEIARLGAQIHLRKTDAYRRKEVVLPPGKIWKFLLPNALRENETKKQKVNALVFVGDCIEERIDDLCALAGELGMLGVPAFIFQEGDGIVATRGFKQIAKLTNGAHCRFDLSSAKQLRDLLSAVAVYAAGGRKALENYSRKTGGDVRLLAQQVR